MPDVIRLSRGVELPVLYEDKWLLAINKPADLLVAQENWERTRRNLMRLLAQGIERRARDVEKTYYALVAGRPKAAVFNIDLPLASHPRIAGRVIVDRKHGKPSYSHVEVAELRERSALLRVAPLTGRTLRFGFT